MDVRQQLRGRGYASSEVHHEALVECVRGCGVRRAVSRDTIYTACERGGAAKRARQRKTHHSNSAGMDRCLAGTTRAGRSRPPAHRRHAGTERRHEPAGDDDGTRSDADTTRALTEREVAELLGLSVATLRAWRHRGKGPRFLRLGRSVRYLPSDVADFVRASAVDTTSVSSSDGESEIGELPL